MPMVQVEDTTSLKVVGPRLEDELYKSGIASLHQLLGDGGLLEFPKRPNGTSLFMRQSFFERMFSGKMELIDFPATDISAAQVDVKHLNLQQLLFIRVENLDFQATSPLLKTTAEFLTAVDSAIQKRVSERLAAGGGVGWADPTRAGDVVHLVLVMYGVHAEMAPGKSDLWLLRFGNLEALLHIPSCELRRLQTADDSATPAAWCYSNMSRASEKVAKSKKQLHWQVELCDRPAEFKETVGESAGAAARRARGNRLEQRLANGQRAEGVAATAIQAKRMEELAAARAAAANDSDPRFQEALDRADRLEAEMETLRQEVASARAAEAASSQEQARLQEEVASGREAEASAREAEAAAAKAQARLQEELEAAQEGKKVIDEELASARAIAEEAESRAAKATEEAEGLRRESERWLAKLAEIDETESRAAKAAEEIEALRQEVEELRASRDSSDEKADAAREEAERLKREMEEQASSRAPVDEAENRAAVEEAESRAAKAKEEAESLRREVEELRTALAASQQEVSSLTEDAAKAEDIFAALEASEARERAAVEEASRARSELEALAAAAEAKEGERRKVDPQGQKSDLESPKKELVAKSLDVKEDAEAKDDPETKDQSEAKDESEAKDRRFEPQERVKVDDVEAKHDARFEDLPDEAREARSPGAAASGEARADDVHE